LEFPFSYYIFNYNQKKPMSPKSSSNSLAFDVPDDNGGRLTIDFVANDAWTVESCAEALMDDLFNDFDGILDGRYKLNYPREGQVYISGRTMGFKMPDVVLPSAVHVPLQSPLVVKDVQTAGLVVNPLSFQAFNHNTKPVKSGVTRLVLMGLGLTGFMLGMVVVIESGLLTTLTTQLNNYGVSSVRISSSDAVIADGGLDLVNYMLGSLTVIEQRGIRNNQTGALSSLNSQATPTLPSPLAVNNISPEPSRVTSPNVVERIYIPVDRSEAPRFDLPPVRGIPMPPLGDSGVTNSSVIPLPSVSESKFNTKQVSPEGVKVVPRKLTTFAPSVSVKESVDVSRQVYTPVYSAHLEGVLELGKSSVALFNLDGVSRRFSLGENIGSTGWILVDVVNGEAIIRRNGEVRSIYTGQRI
jgi:hypothetical protein